MNRTPAAGIADTRQSPSLLASVCGTPRHALGLCGYTAIPEDGRTCF